MTREQLVAAVRATAPLVSATGVVSHEEYEQRLHDLHVHQVELEMQNHQLRESQALLEESRHRYAELYDFAPVAFCTLDREGRVLEANITCSAFLGVERSELIGRSLATLVAPEDRAALRHHIKRCIAESSRVTTEVRVAVKTLGPVPFQLVSTALNGPGGEVIGCKTAMTDISALKRSEERLRLLATVSAQLTADVEIGAAFASVVRDMVPVFADLCFVDLVGDGGVAQRLEVAATGPAKAMLVEALKRPVVPWVELREPVLLSEASPAALAVAIPLGPDRAALVAACGARSLMMVPMVVRERVFGLFTFVMAESRRSYTAADLIFARDVVSRAALALDSSHRYQDAQRAIRARQGILSVVSHDLKTPLTSMMMSVDILTRAAPVEERRKGRVYLERIKRAAVQMQFLIEDLLDLGSIDAGNLSISKEEQSVESLLDDALELLVLQAQKRSIVLTRSPVVTPLGVVCDRRRVLQVLSNLVGNAVKFTPEGGKVTLHAVSEGPSVRFVVEDDGPGMPPEVIRHLFERFWQASETASLGRGLGLFISKGIIESHGGTIWVESRPGEGTRMQFTLPAVWLEKQPVRALAAVLVIEDDVQVRQAAARLLLDRDYGVVPVANGREALDYLQLGGARPQLILLDVSQPEAGSELMRALKADPKLATIPVVVMSSAAQLAAEAKELGAQGFLSKPLVPAQLLAMVDGKRHPSP